MYANFNEAVNSYITVVLHAYISILSDILVLLLVAFCRVAMNKYVMSCHIYELKVNKDYRVHCLYKQLH